MKRGIIILSLFLISVLIISGCIQRGPQFGPVDGSAIVQCMVNFEETNEELYGRCLEFDLNGDGVINILDLVLYFNSGRSFGILAKGQEDNRDGGSINMTIQNINYEDDILEVYMQSTEDIYGVQFSLTGVYVTGASGGISSENGFNFATGCEGECVIVFNLEGDLIPAGEDVLVEVSFEEYKGANVCFKEGEGEGGPYNIISGAEGVELSGNWINDEFSGYEEYGGYGCNDSYVMELNDHTNVGISFPMLPVYQYWTATPRNVFGGIYSSLGVETPPAAGVYGIMTEERAAFYAEEMCYNIPNHMWENCWIGNLNYLSLKEGYIIFSDGGGSVTIPDDIYRDVELGDPNMIYELNADYNYISYHGITQPAMDAFPSDIMGNCITRVLSDVSDGSMSYENGMWIGSEFNLVRGKGYWIYNLCDDISFCFEQPSGSCEPDRSQRLFEPLMTTLEYPQFSYHDSGVNAFYFFRFDSFDFESGDLLVAYHGDEVIGYGEFEDPATTLATVGNDGQTYSSNYPSDGDIIDVRIFRNGEFIYPNFDLPPWSSNGLFLIKGDKLAQKQVGDSN